MLATTQETNAYDTHHNALTGDGVRGNPDWLCSIRKAAFARFNELGFPTTRHEEWQYTNVAPIAREQFRIGVAGIVPTADELSTFSLEEDCAARLVFIDGRFSTVHSAVASLPDGVTVCSLAEAIVTDGSPVASFLAKHATYEDQAFTALNTALLEDGAFVHVRKGTVLERPIHLLYWSTAPEELAASLPRNLIVAEESSQLTVVETYAGANGSSYFTNTVTELIAQDNAVVDHYKINREGDRAQHIGHLQVHQTRDSNVTAHAMTFGGSLVRNDIGTVLDGEGGECTFNGLYMLKGSQHVDNHLLVDHAKPRCDSREIFKGILDDSSRGVFTGRIIVRKDAQKTDGKQTNQNLLLSDDAKADSKPQLEIFADDVKCTHGATIGQVDSDAMFYLQSRGLCKEAARNLLVYAFASDCVSRVRIDSLRSQIETLLFDRLLEGQRPGEAT